MPFIVAIDGPAGAGKSTVARQVASELDLTYLDTGAMYRAVAWKALRNGIAITDAAALAALAQQSHITFLSDPDGSQRVLADGEDVTTAIRAPELANVTSAISALPAVRRVLVEQQREMGRRSPRGVVLEGRDTGTVVFPDAQVKVFLTASPEERARRRVMELQQLGRPVDYARILADQQERDTRDSRRTDSPLVAAPDALVLDTDRMTVGEVVAHILDLSRAHMDAA